jgi:hypothetical protein
LSGRPVDFWMKNLSHAWGWNAHICVHIHHHTQGNWLSTGRPDVRSTVRPSGRL